MDIRLPSLSHSLYPSLYFLPVFLPFFFICLSLRSCYTTLGGLVDSDELQCPTGNTLQRLSSELGRACCLYGCAADQLFYPLICVFMCNHACVQECVRETSCLPLLPGNSFECLGRGGMSQQTKICAHKHCKISPIGAANVRHIWIFQISLESKADGGEELAGLG